MCSCHTIMTLFLYLRCNYFNTTDIPIKAEVQPPSQSKQKSNHHPMTMLKLFVTTLLCTFAWSDTITNIVSASSSTASNSNAFAQNMIKHIRTTIAQSKWKIAMADVAFNNVLVKI
eukprot:523978_1